MLRTHFIWSGSRSISSIPPEKMDTVENSNYFMAFFAYFKLNLRHHSVMRTFYHLHFNNSDLIFKSKKFIFPVFFSVFDCFFRSLDPDLDLEPIQSIALNCIIINPNYQWHFCESDMRLLLVGIHLICLKRSAENRN